MVILTGNTALDFFAIIVTLLAAFVIYFKWQFTYWSRKGVPSLSPIIPFGDSKTLIYKKECNGDLLKRFYHTFKSKGYRYGGVYTFGIPLFVPVDLTLIHNIMIKDFQYFMNHGSYSDEKRDPLSAHLFSLEDEKWKNVRTKLTPTFTTGKMKMMFQTLVECAEGLSDLLNDCADKKVPLDIKDTMARFTTDIISSCAFGLETETLKNPDSSMRYYGKRIFENTSYEALQALMTFIFPMNVLRLIRFKSIKPDVHNFFMDVVKKNVEYRENNNIYRKDFLHLLLQLKNRGKVSDDDNFLGDKGEKGNVQLTLEELAAHCYVFFVAGYETSSTLMTFLLFELSQHQEIQDKVRKEINQVLSRHGGKISYEAIQEMKYMEQAMNEALRKYPPVPFLPRRCSKRYKVPDSSLVIEKGTTVMIPVTGIHSDPDIYPDPEKFDPDRFNEENKSKIPTCGWMPFGEGPRICIGLRFGVMQAKVGIATLLKNHRVTLNKEKTNYPIEFDATTTILSFKGGVWLNVEKA